MKNNLIKHFQYYGKLYSLAAIILYPFIMATIIASNKDLIGNKIIYTILIVTCIVFTLVLLLVGDKKINKK